MISRLNDHVGSKYAEARDPALASIANRIAFVLPLVSYVHSTGIVHQGPAQKISLKKMDPIQYVTANTSSILRVLTKKLLTASI